MNYPGKRFHPHNRQLGSTEPLLPEHSHQKNPPGHLEFIDAPAWNYVPPSLDHDESVFRAFESLPAPLLDHHQHTVVKDRAIPCCSHGCCCCQCVRSQELGVAEDCGSFAQIVGPGFYCLGWPLQTIHRLSLRMKQIDVVCETKTCDGVFCNVHLTVLYRVAPVRAYDAYYQLEDLRGTIQTYVLDVVRSTVPTILLDQLFASQQRIANTVHDRLFPILLQYGYETCRILITRVDPNTHVKDAMNAMNAASRWKQAVSYQAEAAKIETIAQAQAQAEGLHLRGKGVARERQAIVEGMKDSVNMWTMDVKFEAPTAQEAMQLLLISQYLDLLVHVGANSLFVQSDPQALVELRDALPPLGAKGY